MAKQLLKILRKSKQTVLVRIHVPSRHRETESHYTTKS